MNIYKSQSFLRKAFTLIELLVVVAIISILASMLTPSLNKAMDSARSMVCVNNLKQLAQVQAIYSNDSNGVYVLGQLGNAYPNESWSQYLMNLDYIPYDSIAGGQKVFSEASMVTCSEWGWYEDSTKFQWKTQGNYGTNYWVRRKFGNSLPIHLISNPSEILFIGDKDIFQGYPGEVYDSYLLRYNSTDTQGLAGPWHNEGSNIVYFDGHTESEVILPTRPTSTTSVLPWRSDYMK